MLGVAALIGADARVPAMVLQRAPLGQRGSYLATGLNVLQCLGWATFELIIIASAASALSDRAFGFEALWFWKLLFGGVATALALLGPIGFVRRFVRKFAIWAVVAVDRLPRVVDPGARRPARPLVVERRPRRLVLRRDGPDHRAERVVDPARRRLHALLDRPPRRVLGRRARLPLPHAVPVRLRRDPRALASVDRRARSTSSRRSPPAASRASSRCSR